MDDERNLWSWRKLWDGLPWIAALLVVPASLVGFLVSLGELALNPKVAHSLDVMPVFVPEALIALGGIGLVLLGWKRDKASRAADARAETATQKAIENPEQPKLAWEAGRATLEKYLDRNLGQVRTIATLTYVVMFCGFSLICFGVLQAFSDKTKLPVSIVAAASGVLVSFIGGSFMVIYRSLLLQSKDYLFVLERINGVGMAVAVIESIPDESAQLKHATTAELARTLLTLYGAKAP
jgi:hypothetical protein